MDRKWPYELFGVECGKGWVKLYQPLIDLCKLYDIPVLQVKEKFGGLRFYVGGMPVGKDISKLIKAVESASFKTCEDCGEDGYDWSKDGETWIARVSTGPSRTSGWTRSLCAGCRQKMDEERIAQGRKVLEVEDAKD